MPFRKISAVTTALAGFCAMAAAMGIGRFVYTPILPFMSEAGALSPQEAGLVAAANFSGYLAGALAASLYVLPGSRRFWLLAALALSAFTTIAMGMTETVSLFAILRFAGGLASAYALVFATTLVLENLAQAGRPGLSALHFAGVGSGIALSAILVRATAGIDGAWQSLWYVSGAGTLVLLGLITVLLPADAVPAAPASAQKPSGHTPQEVPEPKGFQSQLIPLVLSYGLFGFGYVITATFISLIVREDPELAGMAEFVWLVVGLTAAPSILVWNWIARHIGGARAIALACILQAIGVALSVLGSGLWAMASAAGLLGVTFMGITALGLMQARRLSSGDPGRILAAMTASFGVGQVIGPWVAGQLHAVTGNFQTASLTASTALVAAAGLALFSRRSA
jgi:predicted MFS family arabinose efflux permease